MKENINKKSTGLLLIAMAFLFSSCFKEENITPVYRSFEFKVMNTEGELVPATSATVGEKVYFFLDADVDYATIWCGERLTLKNADGTDKLDFDSGMPMFQYSNDFNDYGIFGSRGFKFQKNDEGWCYAYTFKYEGTKAMKLVLTTHGYDGPEYNNEYIDLNFTINP